MGRQTGEQGGSSPFMEVVLGNRARRPDTAQAEARHHQRVLGDPEDWLKCPFAELLPMGNEGGEDAAISLCIPAKLRSGISDIALERYSCAVIERMSELRRWPNPFKPVLAEGQSRKEGRGQGERVNGRAHVMQKARQG
jgi:hypothetical protein